MGIAGTKQRPLLTTIFLTLSSEVYTFLPEANVPGFSDFAWVPKVTRNLGFYSQEINVQF